MRLGSSSTCPRSHVRRGQPTGACHVARTGPTHAHMCARVATGQPTSAGHVAWQGQPARACSSPHHRACGQWWVATWRPPVASAQLCVWRRLWVPHDVSNAPYFVLLISLHMNSNVSKQYIHFDHLDKLVSPAKSNLAFDTVSNGTLLGLWFSCSLNTPLTHNSVHLAMKARNTSTCGDCQYKPLF
jgi:hypothetical protein